MEKLGTHELLALIERCGHFLYHRRGGKRGQGRILKILLTEGEMTQKELQERLGIQSGSMSEIILKLEGNGWVDRTRDESDRRKIKLRITKEGKSFFEEKHKEKIEQDKKLFEALTEQEQEALKELLTKLFDDWEVRFEKLADNQDRKCGKKHKESVLTS